MINEQTVVAADRLDATGYESSQESELALNAAILRAEIAEGHEKFVAAFEASYADDVEVSHEDSQETIRGKGKVRGLLYNFLVPLHIMAEIGGLLVSLQETAMPGDVPHERHSAWALELVGASGASCTVKWRVFRKWLGSRVVYEHHYDHQQIGEPLTLKDLRFNSSDPITSIQRPSQDLARHRRHGTTNSTQRKVPRMSAETSFIDLALRNWKATVQREDGFFGELSEEQLQQEVAPGKNRLIYIWGHLTAFNDALLPLLGLGERVYPELDAMFITNPDRRFEKTLSGKELKRIWDETNVALWAAFSKLPPSEWLERHTAVSKEDFLREPHRNRFTVLLGRTGHVAYHLGQAMLAKHVK
jgi:hypothetical protein